MLVKTADLLKEARKNKYAVGAFNIYNLEGAAAVVQTAEELKSPVILQILPSGLRLGGRPLVALCLAMAKDAAVPVAVHLDHCPSEETLFFALDCGFSSVMADGSDLDYEDNILFTKKVVTRARQHDAAVEAELGKLSGEEDGLSVDIRSARMTDPEQAAGFVKETEVDALAVCIGNVHGKYTQPPDLDFGRLAAIAEHVTIPLVLHGTSGLPDHMIEKSMEYGVCKFNVNTEVRSAYIENIREHVEDNVKIELIDLMETSIEAMKIPIRSKIQLFCSTDRAKR